MSFKQERLDTLYIWSDFVKNARAFFLINKFKKCATFYYKREKEEEKEEETWVKLSVWWKSRGFLLFQAARALRTQLSGVEKKKTFSLLLCVLFQPVTTTASMCIVGTILVSFCPAFLTSRHFWRTRRKGRGLRRPWLVEKMCSGTTEIWKKRPLLLWSLIPFWLPSRTYQKGKEKKDWAFSFFSFLNIWDAFGDFYFIFGKKK